MAQRYSNITACVYLEVKQGSVQGIESDTREYLAYLSWFAGFASAMSAGAGKEVLNDMDTKAMVEVEKGGP